MIKRLKGRVGLFTLVVLSSLLATGLNNQIANAATNCGSRTSCEQWECVPFASECRAELDPDRYMASATVNLYRIGGIQCGVEYAWVTLYGGLHVRQRVGQIEETLLIHAAPNSGPIRIPLHAVIQPPRDEKQR